MSARPAPPAANTMMRALYDFVYTGDKPGFHTFDKNEIFTFIDVGNPEW